MATISFELDDTIYEAARRMLGVEDLGLFCQALLTSSISDIATGNAPAPTPEMVEFGTRLRDRVNQKQEENE